jgi:dTDP-4-dehydrorhamnose reductase
MNMRIAVIGATGMFGSEMLSLLVAKGIDATGFDRSSIDLEIEPESLAGELGGFDAVVNAVAFTAVDRAEVEIYEANTVNAIYAGVLAQAAKITGAKFIHISTDYVFNGESETPYKVNDQIDPQTSYGKSKALGEQLVSESGADYSILRTAWLYGANGRCFPKVMAEMLKKNGSVKVVDNQIGQPTWTRDLAEMVLQVLRLGEMPRIVHATASGKTSWAGFAKEIAQSIGMSTDSVDAISSSEFPTAAKRPAWSVLDNSSEVITPIGDWRERWHVAAPEVLTGI